MDLVGSVKKKMVMNILVNEIKESGRGKENKNDLQKRS